MQEKLETIENDVNHIMGRGETSDVSGIPTLNRLLTDIDEVRNTSTKTSKDLEDFKLQSDEALQNEIKEV